ncbi:hypothetical protein IGI04_019421 [Brassica rapa subsp. trilocularis]|uniref:Uncharacterized protein n=1 Tax=Brassica rapa subsp. trilocularis TaxID=1813537 RepID=A0ABQ7MFS5_BRACM|nr:hypothetical protein IGI04_019421 [Brassica rapa subsp. trilocularis]
MEGEFRFVLCLRRRCSFIFHPQPPLTIFPFFRFCRGRHRPPSSLSLLSDCGGGCRDGRCRGGGCRYGGRRREEEEVVMDVVMVDAMVVDMDTADA